jgi:hydroxyacylglutathione hydrolase/adenylyltransferase/sulfurtransferase
MTEIEIDPRDAAALVAAEQAVLIDVRTDEEHDAGRIDGAAHIPLAQLSARAGELPGDEPLIFYCRVGARSLMAAQALRAAGRQDARSMAGGIIAWAGDGLAIDGVVADH